MRTNAALALAAGVALLFGACSASRYSESTGHAPTPGQRLAVLGQALDAERDESRIPALLFQHGHAAMEAAESVRGRRGEKLSDGRPSTVYERFVLEALRDFDLIASRYPESEQAPEALFHLGIIYDYPNLSSFEVALVYYRRTMERYPGTESARKARIAVDNFELRLREVMEKRHGVR